MTTARDIIEAALRKISAIGVGVGLSGEEAGDALKALNALLGSWSAQGSMVYVETAETFNITGGTWSYTIGSGGAFNTSRPNVITAAHVTMSGYDYPLDLIDHKEYSAIYDKTQRDIPRALYYDSNFPVATINLFPVPNINGTIKLYTQKPLTTFTDLNTTYAMPPEYERALIYNLAVEVAPEYEREPSMTVMRIANQSKKIVEVQNARNDTNVSWIDNFLMGRGRYTNIDAGQ